MAERDYFKAQGPVTDLSHFILPGQNFLKDRRNPFDGTTKWPVCLGRIRYPVLPLTRNQIKRKEPWLGERALERVNNGRYVDPRLREAQLRTLNRARVAFKVSNVESDVRDGGEQRLYGVVESCGIAPNLLTIIRQEGPTHVCFVPRYLAQPSDEVPHAWRVTELITFDLVAYDPTQA